MRHQSFLIKYGEIGLKGKNRHIFEDKLVSQIYHSLATLDEKFSVRKVQGRMYVTSEETFDEEEVIERLTCVFGIVGVCPVVQIDDNGFDDLAKRVVDYMKDEYGNQALTFKVDARRARKNYPLNSMEINAKIGERVLEAFANYTVDVHKPEVMLHIEIREDINIYSKIIPALGGMPVGSNGKAMLLLSGGIDSPVAGYMIAKRGVELNAIYYDAPPYTSERARQKVIDLAKLMTKYTGPIKLHIVNFTDIQMAIYEKCPHDELTIIMRRYMMRIAEHFANENNCKSLVTGESIGQVASQTMESLAATNAVCNMPVFRPLVGFDKRDIIEISEKINTYETSILPFEDCCTIFVAKHPVTKPRIEVIERSEEKIADIIEGMVEEAYSSVKILKIKAD